MQSRRLAAQTPRYGFFGDYSSWDEASRDAGTYDTKEIAERVSAILPRYLEDKPLGDVDERFQQFHSAVLAVASRMHSRKIKALDVGGGNGAYYLMCLKLSPDLETDWTIQETPSMVKACAPLLPTVRWVSSFPKEQFDLIVISGTLHCLPSPHEFLREVSRYCRWIVLHRVPVTNAERDRIMIQRVDPSIHPGSFPCWSIARSILTNTINQIGRLEFEWTSHLDCGGFPDQAVSAGALIRCS